VKSRIGMITIGVDDLKAALKFYRDGLGFKSEGIIGTEFEHGAIAVFDLQHGLRFSPVRTSPLTRVWQQRVVGAPPSSPSATTSEARAKWMPLCVKPAPPAHGLRNPRRRPFGADIRVTFRTPTVIYKRSYTTRHSFRKIDQPCPQVLYLYVEGAREHCRT